MSSLLTGAAQAVGRSSATGPTRTAVGALAIATPLVVLLTRELVRVELTPQRERRMSHLRVGLVPLTLVLIGVVVPRILDLLR